MIHIPDTAQVAVVGDWHGNVPWIRVLIPYLASEGCTHIIHVGDFGITGSGYYDTYFSRELDRLTAQYGIALWFIRGNHDNPEFLNALPVSSDGLAYLHEHNPSPAYLPDATTIHYRESTILTLGGARSIDRERYPRRSQGWLEGEGIDPSFLFESVEYAGMVDVMITHDAPSSAPLPLNDEFAAQFLEENVAACAAHRDYLQALMEIITPRALIHGHYHHRYSDYGKLSDGHQVRLEGLGADKRKYFQTAYVDDHVLDLARVLRAPGKAVESHV